MRHQIGCLRVLGHLAVLKVGHVLVVLAVHVPEVRVMAVHS